MHINRQNISRFWPVPRKGTKYLAVASHNQRQSIPLIVVMRDILGLVKTKKELKKALNEKQVKINDKKIHEVNYPVCLFDALSIGEKNYRASLSEKKKIIFEGISEKDAQIKIFKVIGKKILGKDKVQINLRDGGNVFVKENVKVGDSIVYNFRDRKVEKIIKMEKGKTGFVFEGKHAGKKGGISDIIERGGKKLVRIIPDGETKKINVWTKNVIVMEK